MKKNNYRDKVIIKRRLTIVLLLLFFSFFVLQGRLFYIMVVKSPSYKALAESQWTNEVKIDAKRGSIFDRNGQELAVSANVYRVDLDMNVLRDTLKTKKLKNEDLAPKLAAAIGMEENDVLKVLNKKLPSGLPLSSATLKRRIEKEQADNVRALGINGILISADTKRYYPNDNLLAQEIGHTNSDGNGLTGLEMYYDKELSGIPGVRIAESDTYRTEMPYAISDFTPPVDGKNIYLTIDSQIQYFCDKAADQAMKDNKAKAVTIMAMDPRNGEILAMVNKPDYNLNDPWAGNLSSEDLQKEWRNRAVSDTFEPGSVFKVFTAASALSEGAVKESDHFYCSGSTKVGPNTIHCWKTSGHGDQDFVQILENSCNVGFMEVGKRVGAQKLCDYINKLGFGTRTGIDLPGEASGIVKKAKDISEVDLATISFGQTNTLSCVQYLTAFNSVANGGKWIRPHFLKEIKSNDTSSKEKPVEFNNYGEKQVLDSEIVKTLRGYLEKVVSEGGGKNAFIEGYHIAGKTGTAQKAGPTGGYMPGKYIATFAGMAPADNPRVTILVSIDEPDPSNYYAGQIAAPVAKTVFNDIFNYLAVNVDASQEDIAKSMRKDVIIPNVRGMKKSDASKILKDVNIDFTVDGGGDVITDTNPIPGISVKEGTKIILYTGTSTNYNKTVSVPNLKGFSKERVTEILNSIGLKATFNGDGVTSDQSIEEGQIVNKGTNIDIKLDKIGD